LKESRTTWKSKCSTTCPPPGLPSSRRWHPHRTHRPPRPFRLAPHRSPDVVEVNQVVAVMEAMKMETNVASPVAGKVKSVGVKAGEPVKAGQVLIELE
jgi:multidrug efflux pump subunit AcrA (membrane-fusion protein)